MRSTLTPTRLGLVVLIALLSSFGFAQVSVLTQHNDNSRTGQNLNETYLNTSTVNVSNFGKIFTRAVDGYIYAQPLYVPNLTIQGQLHNVIYVATEHNSVFAFDADDPNSGTPLWQINLGTSVPSQDICLVQAADGCNGQPWNDLTPEIGITGTPVIDPTTNTLYVVAKTKDTSNTTYHFYLHALDLLGGTEKFSGPVEVTMPSSAPVTFTQLSQLQRPGLLLLNGAVYVAFGSAGDFLTWHGWVVGYDASTLQQLAYFVTTPTDTVFDGGGCTGGGGIFQAGQGLVADSDNIYFTTGNGPFDVETGGADYGDSAIKLSTPALTLADYFAPYNTYNGTNSLGYNNEDLGAGGQLMIPGTTLLIGGGKDGILRLIDSTNMGKFNASYNADVQEWLASSQWIMGSPVYWNGPVLGQALYLWTSGSVLRAYQFNGSTFNTTPVSLATITSPCCEGDTSPLSLSANQNQAGTGIIWAPVSDSGDPSFGPQPGILHAFDASNLSKELWNSQMDAARDSYGNFAKFNAPTVGNGKVYVPTLNSPGQLVVYGLLNPYFTFSALTSSATAVSGSSASYTVSVGGVNGFNSAVTLACSGLPSGGSCSFNPASVSPDSSPATSTVTVTTAAGTAANTYNLSITGSSGSTSQSASVSLIVQIPAGFALSSPTPASVTVNPGTSATFTTTVTPSGGFSGTVTLTCTIATSAVPAPVCTSSPVTVSGPPAQATLTVSTTAPNASSLRSSRTNLYAMLLPLAGMTLMGAVFRSSPRKKLVGLLVMVLLISGLLILAGCGSSSSSGGGGGGSTGGTPAGIYIVTVTASSGSVLTQPITFTLTVQ